MKDNKKKIIIIISIIALLLLLGGVTYAFYGVQTGGNAKGKYHITTSSNELVTAETLIEGLHIKVSASDMSENNINDYYGTDDINLNYVKSEEEGTKKIASISVSNAEESLKQSCTVKVNVSISGEMSDVLESDDLILNLKAQNSSQNVDLSIIKNIKTISYKLKFNLVGNEVGYLEAYLRLKNREDKDQSYLAGKKLELNIEVEKIECEIVNELPIIEPDISKQLRKDSDNTLTEDLVGGMYRYQGTDNVNNWICFGTDKETCNTPSTDPNYEEIVDKYMYRIIGITPTGQLKLIKETVVREETTETSGKGVVQGTDEKYYQTAFQWHNIYLKEDCGENGEKCTWPLSRLFNRLNGLCNSTNKTGCTGSIKGNGEYINHSYSGGDSNIFIGNIYYEYLNDGSNWLNKIDDVEWKYGDSTTTGYYNGDAIYEIEEAFNAKTQKSKIGLMYIHDYLYTYPGGNPGNYSNAGTTWVTSKKTGLSVSFQHLLTRRGYSTIYDITSMNYWFVYGYAGDLMYQTLIFDDCGARPVFYLKNSTKIIDGNGSKAQPYIIQP